MSSEEENVQSKSINASKINRLKNEIKSLRGKYENIRQGMYEKKKRIQETTEQIRERVNPQTGPWYLLVQYRNGDWVQYGKFDSPDELKREANKIKDLRRKKNSNIKNYYVTDNEREMQKIVKIQVHRERKYHEEMKTELRGQPYSRYSENIKAGLKIPEEKAISKEVSQYSGYSGKPSGMMPRMSVGAWGSLAQPRKTNLPSFGEPEKTKPRKQKIILPHEQYQSYLDSGYTKQQLSDMGIFSKRSEFFTESSPFPNAVTYKPVGYYQSFVHINPPLTEYQKRIAEGRPYEPFRPQQIQFKKIRW